MNEQFEETTQAIQNNIYDGIRATFFRNRWYQFGEHLIKEDEQNLNNSDKEFIDELTELLINSFLRMIHPNNQFFRARIIPGEKLTVEQCPVQKGEEEYTYPVWDVDRSDIRGYSDLADVGAPPAGIAKANRASPKGISFLYVADNIYTAVSEVRPSMLELVNVAEFTNKLPMNIIWLPRTHGDAKQISTDCNGIIDNYLYEIAKTISWAFSRPIRSSDLDKEYRPTQYLVENLKKKSSKIDGIAYPSFQSHSGMNYAIFDPHRMPLTPTKEKIIRIQNIYYKCCNLNDLSEELVPTEATYDETLSIENIRKIKSMILQNQNEQN